MATKAKQPVVTTEQRADGTLAFIIAGEEPVVFNPAKAHPSNRARAEQRGWKERAVDAAALSRDTMNGASATPSEKRAAILALMSWYMEGGEEWSRHGGGVGGLSLTLEAVAKVRGVTYEAAEASVEAYAKEKFEGDMKKALAFLRQGERVMAAMDEIRKGRMGAPKVDADAALGELA